MDTVAAVLAFCLSLVLAHVGCAADLDSSDRAVVTATAEWYRTAQGTSDRLTQQPDLTFGADFPSEATIQINRYYM